MKPNKFSPAHKSKGLAELVCSNSLKAISPEKASGILKLEMLELDSLIIDTAYKCKLPVYKLNRYIYQNYPIDNYDLNKVLLYFNYNLNEHL